MLIVLFNWGPILMFIGFSGGFKKNQNSCTTFKYDDSTNILTGTTMFTDKDEILIEKFVYKNQKWYSLPNMKKCNKKDSDRCSSYL